MYGIYEVCNETGPCSRGAITTPFVANRSFAVTDPNIIETFSVLRLLPVKIIGEIFSV